MPTYNTADRYGLRALSPGSVNVVADIDAGFVALRDDVSAKLTESTAGVRGSRPVSTGGSPGILGRTYRSTGDGGLDLDTGTSWVTIKPGLFTALPTASGTGAGLDTNMEILYQTAAMASASVGPWALRYDAGLSGTSKWRVLGADPWIADTLGSGDRSSTAYGNLTDGAGPSIAPAVAGLYLVQVGCEVYNSNPASGGTPVAVVSYAIGATAASDDDRAAHAVPQTYTGSLLSRPRAKTIGAADAIVAKYAAFNTTNNGFTVSQRHLSVTPLRLG